MTIWNGLDSGGVEQLWDDTLLLGALQIFSDHQPFAYGAVDSELYDDLNDAFPDMTWYSVDRMASNRTIFRRANPFMKLGLIEGSAQEAVVTDWGKELLSGQLTLKELYQIIAKSFVENNGDRSFALMCNAALKLPLHVFSPVDVEFAVSKADGTESDLRKQISNVRSMKQKFPRQSRRPRVIRRFLNTLVSAGALKHVEGGWLLNEKSAANFIVNGGMAIEIDDRKSLNLLSETRLQTRIQSFEIKPIAVGKRKIPGMRADAFSQMDNSARMLLLERANKEHEHLVELAANEIRKIGGSPLEGTSTFDIGCTDRGPCLIEAKHINQKNGIAQFRKAIAQLPEYRWRHQDTFPTDTKQIIVVSEDPKPLVGVDYLGYVSNDRGLKVMWPSPTGLVGLDHNSLRGMLIP